MNFLSSSSTLFISSLLLLAFLSYVVIAACPHNDASLVKWSTVGRLNVENAKIEIAKGERLLLDKSPGVLLQSIEVSGEVVVADANIELDVGWVKVNEGGKWIVGSSSCRITNKFILTLHGQRTTNEINLIPADNYDGVVFGSKGFVVATEGILEIYGANSGPTWARLSKTANMNDDTIYLDTDVQWKVGDMIVVASTDYSEIRSGMNRSHISLNWLSGTAMPDQSENATIKAIEGRTVTLNKPLNYMHWGSGVQRAEVGLLTHNIKFQGDESSDQEEFGGHLMMRKALKIHIEGVEFTRFGQRGFLGRYPVHFHVQREVMGMEFNMIHCSIHNNYQRSLVIHESHGVLIQDVVGYRTLGHMFFLEDGGERMNTLDRVLGISAFPVAREEIKYDRIIQIIPTDSDAAIFWVTNMNNTIINCVAVGGRFGFWMLMPVAVTGASNILYPSTYNPRRVGVNQFRDNIAHSCADTGFEFDNFLTANGFTEEGGYNPSPSPVFSGLVAYKCRQFGIWGKSSMEFYNAILMDNRRGLMVNGATLIHDSLFVGESDNIGRALKGHTRSFPDSNGQNTSKVCGHESYDNGGPQYSFNNVFVNFVGTATRKVGALCPLQTGPFMLDTENRVFNLTFISANRVAVGSPRTGDNEYGWTILDNDGSVTGLKGGGWIVSQNASHLLNADCTYRPDWEAWICPPFDAGYVQITITHPSSAPSVDLNGYDVSSDLSTTTRNTRGIFYEMGSTKFGKVLGAKIDCNGVDNGCYQFMHNVMPRKFYTIRYVVNDVYVQTPETVSVNMHSAWPGDYVFVAIPYPRSAAPFNISYSAIGFCSAVNHINDLNATTYFYDTNSEHLYLRLRTTVTQANQGMRNFTIGSNTYTLTDYSGTSSTYTVKTSCSPCSPSVDKLKVPGVPKLTLKEEKYKADLQTCQVAGKRASSGDGSAFFWFYPATQELQFNIYHNVALTAATSVELGTGKPGTEDYILTSKSFRFPTSPLRGIFTLSLTQWADLVKGNLFMKVNSKSYPDGHIKGQILCTGICNVPPTIANVNPCIPTGKFESIFTDYAIDATEKFGNDETVKVYSSDAVCGNTSVQLNIKSGYFQLTINSKKIITVGSAAVYKFIEFYIRVLPGSGEFSLYVTAYNATSNQRVRTISDYVNNYLIDEYFGWTRVKIPFSEFTLLPDTFDLTRIGFTLTDTGSSSPRRDFLIDEVRVIAGGNEPSKPLATAADVVKYGSNLCAGIIGSEGSEGQHGSGEFPTPTPTLEDIASSSSTLHYCVALVVVVLMTLF